MWSDKGEGKWKVGENWRRKRLCFQNTFFFEGSPEHWFFLRKPGLYFTHNFDGLHFQSPYKLLTVELVADDRNNLVAADHPPDEEKKILSGTQNSTPATPTHILLVERAGLTRWLTGITSPEN